jgi:phosphoribosyl-AMP cyclohydrolase
MANSDSTTTFGAPGSTEDVEEGHVLTPKFDEHGLITAVTADIWSGEVLMVAHMNAEALRRTIDTGEAWYFSRSRGVLWKKGEASGHTQQVRELWVDCDQDAVVIKVEQQGPGACHTGRKSCFYRRVPLRQPGSTSMEFREAQKTFDPNAVYGKASS